MSWQTNSFVVSLRDWGRALGLNDWVAARFASSEYEAAFDDAFAGAIGPGDVVWDVGANVGYYTSRFADKVGAHGCVVAYEPSPDNFERLSGACGTLHNVTLRNHGLGRRDEVARFQQGVDRLGATSRISPGTASGIEVELRSGASVVEAAEVKPPNAIKVDVEGYELEVLDGLGAILQQPAVRVVGIEIHFAILKNRGMPSAPREIESRLRQLGFSMSWPDRSHLLALRHAQ